MSAGYYAALKTVFKDHPEKFQEIVLIDRFHVAKSLNEKVDNKRKSVLRSLKETYQDNEEVLEELKNTMWPFRHHPADIDDDQSKRLNTFFEYSPELKKCYELREDLYTIFENKDLTKEEARIQINNWCQDTQKYQPKGYNLFTTFIKTYRSFEEHILNYFTHRISSGAVEGLNNKAKVVKRRGFGFRNVLNFAKRLFLDVNYRDIFLPC